MLKSRGTTCRSRLPALVGAALVVLTACQGDPSSSPSDDSKSTTTPTSDSVAESVEKALSEATESPTDETAFDIDAPENLDPCSIVPRDTWIELVPRKGRDTAQTDQLLVDNALPIRSGGAIAYEYYPKYACVVTYADGPDAEQAALSWGWYLGQFGPPKVNKMYADLGATKYDRGTYAALTGGDLITSNAVGLSPPHTGFFVVVDAPASTDRRQEMEPDEDGKGEVFTLDRRKLEILDLLAPYALEQPPVQLPEGCPGARDAAITAVMGKVTFARGHKNGDGKQFCLYRSTQRDTVLRLTGGVGTEDVLDDFLEGSADEGRKQDQFEGSSGAQGRAVVDTRGLATGTLVDPDEPRYAFASVEHSDFVYDSPRIPRPALIELLESFYASVPTAPVD